MCHIVVTWVLQVITLNKYQCTSNYITAITLAIPVIIAIAVTIVIALAVAITVSFALAIAIAIAVAVAVDVTYAVAVAVAVAVAITIAIIITLTLAVAIDKEWSGILIGACHATIGQHPSTCGKGVGYTLCPAEAEGVKEDIVDGTGKNIML